MKKAKFALTAIIVFSIMGSGLAFKASRQFNKFYSFGQTQIDGQLRSGCIVEQVLQLTPAASGGWITTLYSSAFQIPATTCTARVTFNG